MSIDGRWQIFAAACRRRQPSIQTLFMMVRSQAQTAVPGPEGVEGTQRPLEGFLHQVSRVGLVTDQPAGPP